MGIEEAVLEKRRALHPDKQQAVLDFLSGLEGESVPSAPHLSLRGLCEDLGLHVTEEEIDEARRAIWANFPQEGSRWER